MISIDVHGIMFCSDDDEFLDWMRGIATDLFKEVGADPEEHEDAFDSLRFDLLEYDLLDAIEDAIEKAVLDFDTDKYKVDIKRMIEEE